MLKVKFLDHSHGEFTPEGGTKSFEYDNIVVSDGLRSHKLTNQAPESQLQGLVEGDEISIDLGFTKKGLAVVKVDKIKK